MDGRYIVVYPNIYQDNVLYMLVTRILEIVLRRQFR